MWARAHKRTHKNLDIDSGLGIIQPDGEVRYFSSFNNSLVMAPEVGSSCFRGFLLKKGPALLKKGPALLKKGPALLTGRIFTPRCSSTFNEDWLRKLGPKGPTRTCKKDLCKSLAIIRLSPFRTKKD
jgi:hypothetical protein